MPYLRNTSCFAAFAERVLSPNLLIFFPFFQRARVALVVWPLPEIKEIRWFLSMPDNNEEFQRFYLERCDFQSDISRHIIGVILNWKGGFKAFDFCVFNLFNKNFCEIPFHLEPLPDKPLFLFLFCQRFPKLDLLYFSFEPNKDFEIQ